MNPEPPTDVRLILDDGHEILCDVKYRGEEDGTHIWDTVIEGDEKKLIPRIVSFNIGKLPAKTAVSLPAFSIFSERP